MPSHLREICPSKWPIHVTDQDVTANDLADKYAGVAADSVQIPLSIAIPYLILVKRVSLIQKRLATILSNLPHRDKPLRKKPRAAPAVVKPDLNHLISESQHNIAVVGPRLRCRDCLSSFHQKDPSCKQWLCAPCVKPHDDREMPVRIIDVFHIGNQVTHVSHELYSFKALVYCKLCGSYARASRLVNLAKECTKHPTDAGQCVLDSIASGVMPGANFDWPIVDLED